MQSLYIEAIKPMLKYDSLIELNEKRFQNLNADLYAHIPEIAETYGLWSDNTSKLQYLNFVKYCLLAKAHIPLAIKVDNNLPRELFDAMYQQTDVLIAKNGLTRPTLTMKNPPKAVNITEGEVFSNFAMQQYRYPHWVDVCKGDVFLDCGAFIGDTSIWALQKGATVHSFEPILENFEDTKNNLQQNGFGIENCHNFAVGTKNEDVVIKMHPECKDAAYIPFKTQGVNPSGYLKPYREEMVDVTIKSVRLDDFCREHSIEPTFIKMDIEGFELAALQGAEEIIKNQKPKLAICLYHQDTDLWEIPLYLKSLVPEYKFFCRENVTGSEFVLYATTGDRQ